MGENPYKTPVDDRILEGIPARLTRTWKRFLALIEELGSRVSTIEEILPGIAPGPPLARIATRGEDATPEGIPAGAWTPIKLGSTIDALPPINMELLNNQLCYINETPSNITFNASIYLNFSPQTVIEIGFRKNGDDATVIELNLSSSRQEFAASIMTAYDMELDDYIEVVARVALSVTFNQQNVLIYAQHTGFEPNGE